MYDIIDQDLFSGNIPVEKRRESFETTIQRIVELLAHNEYERAYALSLEFYKLFNKGLRFLFNSQELSATSIKYPQRRLTQAGFQEERLLSLISFSKIGAGRKNADSFNEFRWILEEIQKITQ